MSLAFFLYGADFELCECKNSTRSSLGFFFPFHFWHNSAAELILLRLSKKTWTETRHMIFHTERNWFLKRQSSWGRARSGMLGWGSPLGGAKRADPGASQEEEKDSGHRQKGREAPMVVLSAPGVHWCAPCPPVPPFTRVPSQPCSPLRSPHEHVWRLRRGGQRLWFSLEEPFVPQFSAVYPKCSLLPSSAVPSPLPCDPVPCVFWALLQIHNFFHRGYSG